MKPSAIRTVNCFPPAPPPGLMWSRHSPILFKSHTFLQRLHIHHPRTSASMVQIFTSRETVESVSEPPGTDLYTTNGNDVPFFRNGSGLLSLDS